MMMQMLAFFLAFFSSASWLIYAVMFVRSKLLSEGLWEQSPEMMLTLLAVVMLPLLTIWMIFGYVNQYINNRQINRKQTELLTQLQKNQDYTDLVVRVMLDAEHEIKDGFVINKFEVLINDMNEALSEIIQRCNIASSTQLEQLWQRVGRGEKWSLGKAVLEASKSRSTFDAWVKEKVGRDKVFRGALLEFCSRYQNLLQLLEKHDRDRVFIRMIEMGVLGKVYSIIAPMASGSADLTIFGSESLKNDTAPTADNDYASVLKLATMAEPSAQNTIMNVDRSDDDQETDTDNEDIENGFTGEKTSIFSRFKLFGHKTTEDEPSMADQDPFFKALHNSFQNEPKLENNDNEEEATEPHFSPVSESNATTPLTTGRAFEHNFESRLTTAQAEKTYDSDFRTNTSVSDFASRLAAVRGEALKSAVGSEYGTNTLANEEKTTAASSDEDNEDLVYPFGGWTDENNYGK